MTPWWRASRDREAGELYPQFSERLARVEQLSDGIGWGFHDFVAGLVGQLEAELGEQWLSLRQILHPISIIPRCDTA
jgi:hypothetical protein